MGREIRMVPKGWEHPKNNRGHFQPMLDESFSEDSQQWWDRAVAYHTRDVERYVELGGYLGDDPQKVFAEHPWMWQWEGNPPDPEYYRPEWTEPADHFQMYETVSEGTPVSPVFATKGELAQWIVENLGYSEDAASRFCEMEWAPSMMICNGQIHSNIGVHEPGICGKDGDS